jgi:hypothetical protein
MMDEVRMFRPDQNGRESSVGIASDEIPDLGKFNLGRKRPQGIFSRSVSSIRSQ